ncbi:MAG: carboxypeptidase-like regulatory domain-containing protein [Bacteroides xylanisolvens]
MKQFMLFVAFIFTSTICTFGQQASSSQTLKVKENKRSEQVQKNEKGQSTVSPNSIFGSQIKGIVYDSETREPIIGANVSEFATSNSTVTDINGQYSLRVSSADQKKIVASYIGYKTQAIKIGNLKVVNFFLVTD